MAALNPSVSLSSSTMAQGELSSLDLPAAPTGAYQITKYPEDLGSQADNLHYVVFYIDVPLTSKYITSGQGTTLDVPTASQQNFDYMQSQGGRSNKALTATQGAAATGVSALSGAVTGALAGGASGAVVGGVLSSAGTAAAGVLANQLIELRPKLKRISECVAIYMPNEITTTYSHSYATKSVTAALGKLGEKSALAAGALNTIGKMIPGGSLFLGNETSATQAEAGAQLAAMTGQVGPGFEELALKSAGVAKNPQNELIFEGTDFRNFSFNFRFQPRSVKEAKDIQKIIYTFRRFAAPEMLSGTQNGRYFIPPAQFDIKFYFKNQENENIFKISTCVLESVTPNYAGAGQWISFDDGVPAEISLNLKFKEADVIYRELIEKFGY
jgi:Tail-tube assembly protein